MEKEKKEFRDKAIKDAEEKVGRSWESWSVAERADGERILATAWSRRDAKLRPIVEDALRKHGPKPHMGYDYYIRSVGVTSPVDAEKYFSSKVVQHWVEEICPVKNS